jgi:arylsulfatase A-like enzyme
MQEKSFPAPMPPASDQWRRAGDTGAILFLLSFVLLIVWRGVVIYGVTREIAHCRPCMAATAMQQDAGLLALMLVFTGGAWLTRRHALQWIWTALGIALVLVFVADTLVTQVTAMRLHFFDLIKFRKELGSLFPLASIFIATPSGKITLAGFGVTCVVLALALLPRTNRPRLAVGCFGIAAALALFSQWRPATMNYIRYELLENIIAANLNLGVDQPYSQVYAERIAAGYSPPAAVCQPGQSRRPDVIVLAVESLSMHHSMLFGGARDLTPRLDAIAHEHAWFPDFIANGFTTDGGLIAMVTGRVPIPAVGRYQSADAFAGFDDPRGTVPDLLRPAGYSSHYFTTADLGFLDQIDWLKALHFDSWEGAEHPFYNGWKRRHFNAAEDRALYRRFVQWLDQRTETRPFAAFLVTVGTHPPFIDPRNDQPGEEGVLRYADEQIGLFYAELKKRGFFSHGILLITGDHRSMTPLLRAEQKRFGDTAMARVPLVVVSDLPLLPRGAVAGLFQQTDIVPSLADLTRSQACRTQMQGVFLRPTPVPATYALHARGDMRDVINVFFDHGQADIVLNGDHSYWRGAKPADWRSVFDGVMLDRIRRGVSNKNLLDWMFDLRAPKQPDTQK